MNLNDILDIMVPVRIEPEPLQDITVGTRFLSKGSNEVEYRVSDITGETVTLETNFYNRKEIGRAHV